MVAVFFYNWYCEFSKNSEKKNKKYQNKLLNIVIFFLINIPLNTNAHKKKWISIGFFSFFVYSV